MKIIFTVLTFLVGLLGSVQAFAVSQYDGLTAAASFTEAITAILAVFAVMASLYVVVKGGKMIIAAIKGA